MELKVKNRLSLSFFFFVAGLCFSTWASRIPDIKSVFYLNEAELGSILLVMPISAFIGLPISGWLVNKFDSRLPLIIGVIFQCCFLVMIAIANTTWQLATTLFLFAFTNRVIGISINTQAIVLQKLFTKKINGSFHALWSVGGIVGVGFSTIIIPLGFSLLTHYMIVAIFVLITSLFSVLHMIKNDKSRSANGLVFRRPDSHILMLGLIILFGAICEGSMFDWSGVYFKEVVQVEVFTTGYFVFMTSMAISRFTSDWFIQALGMKKVFILSAICIAGGLILSVVFPMLYPALIGFSLVGIGTAAVVPMVFSLAGNSPTYSPAIAISLIATFGMVGILMGPPLIGYIAHLINLRASFLMIACISLLIIPGSMRFFKLYQANK